jgi:hypothetical protein
VRLASSPAASRSLVLRSSLDMCWRVCFSPGPFLEIRHPAVSWTLEVAYRPPSAATSGQQAASGSTANTWFVPGHSGRRDPPPHTCTLAHVRSPVFIEWHSQPRSSAVLPRPLIRTHRNQIAVVWTTGNVAQFYGGGTLTSSGGFASNVSNEVAQ